MIIEEERETGEVGPGVQDSGDRRVDQGAPTSLAVAKDRGVDLEALEVRGEVFREADLEVQREENGREVQKGEEEGGLLMRSLMILLHLHLLPAQRE